MIDDTSPDDRLDGQLMTLQRVVAPAAPPRAAIEAIVARNQVRRTRTRRAAGALAALVVMGTSALVLTTLDGDPTDVSTRIEPRSEVESERPDPDTGGNEQTCGGDLAGPEPARGDLRGDLAGVSDALEARFPSCFGGIVRTGPTSADVYVIDLVPEVVEAAGELVGPDYRLNPLPSDKAFADIRALKARIDGDAGPLHAVGVETAQSAIRISSEGPRVYLGISPYTPEAAAQLEELYGADSLIIDEYGATIPG